MAVERATERCGPMIAPGATRSGRSDACWRSICRCKRWSPRSSRKIGHRSRSPAGWSARTPTTTLWGCSPETIYRSLFIQARGVLRRELVSHLRRVRTMRSSKHASREGQGRGGIVDAVSIREWPAELEDRAVPGSLWEGDLTRGSHNTPIATLRRATLAVPAAGQGRGQGHRQRRRSPHPAGQPAPGATAAIAHLGSGDGARRSQAVHRRDHVHSTSAFAPLWSGPRARSRRWPSRPRGSSRHACLAPVRSH